MVVRMSKSGTISDATVIEASKGAKKLVNDFLEKVKKRHNDKGPKEDDDGFITEEEEDVKEDEDAKEDESKKEVQVEKDEKKDSAEAQEKPKVEEKIESPKKEETESEKPK